MTWDLKEADLEIIVNARYSIFIYQVIAKKEMWDSFLFGARVKHLSIHETLEKAEIRLKELKLAIENGLDVIA